MAKHRMTQIMPHDSSRSSLLTPKIMAKFKRVPPYEGDRCRWGGLKSATFDEKRTIIRKWYTIDA